MHIGVILAFLTSLLVGTSGDVRIELAGEKPRIVRIQRRDGSLRVELLGATVQPRHKSVHMGVVDSLKVQQSGDFVFVDVRVNGQPRVSLRQESGRTVLAISTHELVQNPPFEFDHEQLSVAVARMSAALDCHYVLEPRAAHLIVTGVFEDDDPLVSLKKLVASKGLELTHGGGFIAVGSSKSLRALSMESIERGLASAPGVRHEILLEHVPAAAILPSLKRSYRHLWFGVMPQTNGFYVSGSVKDILRLKSEIGRWDTVSKP